MGSEWMAESPGDLKVDQVPGEHKQILECLGAAVIMCWSSLTTKSNGTLPTLDFPRRPRADNLAAIERIVRAKYLRGPAFNRPYPFVNVLLSDITESREVLDVG